MARDTRKAFFDLADRLEPQIRDAFVAAFEDIRSSARMTALESALERGDVQGVISVLHLLDDEFFAPLDRQIENVFYQGGVYQLARLPEKPLPLGGPIIARFDLRAPRAEAWVRRTAGNLIREIQEDQRNLVRETVERGIFEGRNPRSVALDLVGRTDRGRNRRTGGLIGLTSHQGGYVQAMREELSNPDLMRNYFKRRLRDRRFDRSVAKAMREGRAMSKADIAKITGRYKDRLLAYRGEVVARTEAIHALNAGRHESVEQLIDKREVPRSAVKHTWSATKDKRTRDPHMAMDGQEVIQGQPFTSPSGAQLLHPGDTSLGATGEDVIQCRCYAQVSIDWLSLAA